MKTNLKKASLAIAGLLVSGSVLAQSTDTTKTNKDYVQPFSSGNAYRTWSIGINGGMLSNYTFLGNMGKQDFTSAHEQIGYSGYINYQLLPSFGLQANYLGGKVEGGIAAFDNTGASPYQKFSTQFNSVSLNGNFTLANINWRHNKGFIQPYLTLGGGWIGYKPTVTNGAGQTADYKADGNHRISEFFIPVGAGLKFDIAPGVNLDLGYTINFVNADNFDGYNVGSTDDRFSYAHIGLEFALGKRSKPQLATHNPVSSMRTEYLTQEAALQIQLNQQKAANEQLRSDLNSTNATVARLTTDSDGDGVPDAYDKCPGTPAGVKVDGSGCPLPEAKNVKVYVTEEDKKVVREAIKDLEFDFGKATIRDHSFPSLDRVAQLLIDKNFSLKLAGHTDNIGKPESNMRLSKERAEAVKAYLVSKGANASRIEATGYGQTQPIASNKTDAGRQQNRRVEFTLF